MTCYYPISLPQTHNRPEPLTVPCGRCIGCRLERSRQWAIRCVCESQMHEDNCFLTLTYRDDELLYGGAEHAILFPRHLQLFWKRLRKHFKQPIRYFACGEYGDKSNRPHYHACVFGLDFQDKELWQIKDGYYMYTSPTLDFIWTHGMCVIGAVNFETAAYVARYLMKKSLGKGFERYARLGIEPEFVRMSRGGRKKGSGGIGASWYDKFKSDIYPNGVMSVRHGIKGLPPKYFERMFKAQNPLLFDDIGLRRFDDSAKNRWNQSPSRLLVRYRVKVSQVSSLFRHLE